MGNQVNFDPSNNNANPNLPQASTANQTVTQSVPADAQKFPHPSDLPRLSDYEYFNHLLMGEHYEAFSIRIDNTVYGENYGKLRYVSANFAGLLSKVCADMLFSEPITLKVDDDGDQEWIDAWAKDNRLNEQLYEAALDASALGDACFKLRVGTRNNSKNQKEVILEEFTPTIFFPQINAFNVRAQPDSIILAWTFKTADKKEYLRQEIHFSNKIEDHVFDLVNGKIGGEVDLSILGIEGLVGVGHETLTGIDEMLVFHVPNSKTGNRYFGISDYYDLDKLFFALNNRITKIDNILDRHSDPILMVPDGVLDEKGQVQRSALHMIEVPEGNGAKQKPEYIVWNANLEAAFSQIEKLIDFFMMTAEITPDVLGMGEGMNDSGRALKFKLMRTIAKVQRKKLYFDRAIKDIIYVAQLLAVKWNLTAGEDSIKFKGKPQRPEIDWQDGLPIDDYEDVDMEIKKIDAGIQTKKDAIMNIDDIDEELAEEKLKEIQDENAIDFPIPNLIPTQITGTTTPVAGATPTKPTKPLAKQPPIATPKK